MFLRKLTYAAAVAHSLRVAAAESEPLSIVDIAIDTEDFSTLVEAVTAAGLNVALDSPGSFTLFAPTNAAFGKVPADIVNKLLDPAWQPQLMDLLLYHALDDVALLSTDLSDGLEVTMLNGEDVVIDLDPARINDESNILVDDGLVDILASNGVIHAIDTVLAPASLNNNIVDILAAGDDALFSTLVAAATAAGLVDDLSGEGPFTVFAPSNDAFDKLPAGTVDSLLLPENMDQLVEILLLHVFQGNVHSSSLISGEVMTLNGSPLAIDVSSDGVMVNDANVVIPDIIASNGIIHAIDAVLLPPPSVPGSSYCTYSPDMTCYESGWPSCCMEDGGETCAEERPPCEIDGPTTATDICLTEEDCEASAYDQGFTSFYKGSFPMRKGCFSKNGYAHFGEGGSVEEMSVPDLPGSTDRIYCATSKPDAEYTACVTEDECATAVLAMGIDDYRPGDWPTKGCFTKNGIAYFSIGSIEEMSTSSLPGIRERLWCGVAESASVNSQQSLMEYQTEARVAASGAFSIHTIIYGFILHHVVLPWFGLNVVFSF